MEQTNLRTDIEKLTFLEEVSWRQKSRVLHLRDGDANTKIFHRVANSHRRNNGIESLMVDGILSSNQGMIADCITQFFMKLYSMRSKLLDRYQKSWYFLGYLVIMQIG